MSSVKVLVRELDKHNRLVQNHELQLPVKPDKNDKLVFDVDGIGFEFRIADIHVAPSGIDIYAYRGRTVTELEGSIIRRN